MVAIPLLGKSNRMSEFNRSRQKTAGEVASRLAKARALLAVEHPVELSGATARAEAEDRGFASGPAQAQDRGFASGPAQAQDRGFASGPAQAHDRGFASQSPPADAFAH
jgi:hypothetical protein